MFEIIENIAIFTSRILQIKICIYLNHGSISQKCQRWQIGKKKFLTE